MSLVAIVTFFTTNAVMFFCVIAMFFFVFLYRNREQDLKTELKEKDRLIVQLNTSIEELEQKVQERRVIATFGGYDS
ncbi:hypothetical protein MEI_01481 [Bartonella vinsonii subsp. arupensis Pm136co]|uniref:Phage shock protein B n=1 Tax=Bartonella vinsonii subsp. arupensis Pm136co TaxID=1094561 RepID=A0ABN0GNN0_BARVI|nr:hypothetical protein [Bartonella vinsonii]EJF96869.1 hypothetical protein MEI_01481 [Bartonella vinsonii subsp. arupensis Pm136co]